MNKNLKQFSIILLMILGVLFIYQLSLRNKRQEQEISYSRFLTLVESRRIKTSFAENKFLLIKDQLIRGVYIDPAVKKREVKFKTYIAYTDGNLIPFLKKHKVNFQGSPKEENVFWRSILYFLPWILIIGCFWFIF